jgi:hypothetical protein
MNTNEDQSWQLNAISAIQNNWIPHRNQLKAETAIYTTLVTASLGDVICVVGPSRVGKSSLTQMIARRVVGSIKKEESLYKPFVRISTRNGGRDGKFTTKSFLLSALKVMGHPMLATSENSFYDLTITRQLDRVKPETLQSAFEDSIRYLKVRYLLIDEVQHLMHIAGGLPNVLPILDSWKSMAEDLEIILVLTGAYPILQVMLQSPHMVGRKSEIHFPRYQANSVEDVAEFSRILLTLDQVIGGGKRSSLIHHNEFLYKGSLGCVGLLNHWIICALREAYVEDSSRLLEKHLISTRRSCADIESMRNEIEFGEDLLRNDQPMIQTPIPTNQSQGKQPKGARNRRAFESKTTRFTVSTDNARE